MSQNDRTEPNQTWRDWVSRYKLLLLFGAVTFLMVLAAILGPESSQYAVLPAATVALLGMCIPAIPSEPAPSVSSKLSRDSGRSKGKGLSANSNRIGNKDVPGVLEE